MIDQTVQLWDAPSTTIGPDCRYCMVVWTRRRVERFGVETETAHNLDNVSQSQPISPHIQFSGNAQLPFMLDEIVLEFSISFLFLNNIPLNGSGIAKNGQNRASFLPTPPLRACWLKEKVAILCSGNIHSGAVCKYPWLCARAANIKNLGHWIKRLSHCDKTCKLQLQRATCKRPYYNCNKTYKLQLVWRCLDTGLELQKSNIDFVVVPFRRTVACQ